MNALEHIAWERFLDGHWQSEMPERAGTYPVATFDGVEAGTKVVYRYGGVYEAAGGKWGAWWWSVPMPRLPVAPAKLT